MTSNVTRRSFLKAAAGTSAAVSVAPAFLYSKSGENVNRPNVLLLMTDDQHWDEIGYNGHGIHTPHIDEMAATGIEFTRYYAGHSRCGPTRACIMTGRNNVRTGSMAPNKFVEGQDGINKNEKCLPLLFKAAGYRTGHFGKWHLDEGGSSNPIEMGFDHAIWSHNHYNDGVQFLIDDTGERMQTEGDCSEATVRIALDFIKESVDNDSPFFATIWYGSPHASYESSEEYRSLYPDSPCQEYLAEITGIDVSVGILREELEKMGVDQNTQIWFCTDNGASGQGGCGSDVCGADKCYESQLSRRKRSMYEGGIRVPGTLIWPAVITSPKVIDIPVSGLDFYPTFKEMLGVEYPDDQPMPLDGENVMSIIMGEADDRNNPLPFWGIDTQQIEKIHAGADSESALVEKRFKILRSDDAYKLFDLIEDQKEENDISEQHPEKFQEMKEKLIAFEESAALSVRGNDYTPSGTRRGLNRPAALTFGSIRYNRNTLQVKMRVEKRGKAELSVWNAAGQRLGQKTVTFETAGKSRQDFALPNLNRGVYYLTLVTDAGQIASRPFLVP